ncbi:hypothetical protein PIB30_033171 [Stylosanthes scabra]|uniref:F-box domain-containing protein n=1 Tax=Stylosanthes scabra TaxID=79078 RepID=A0ABU6ZA49_9FABA|nr:hypothetical protein [Stylosanthes scabra]
MHIDELNDAAGEKAIRSMADLSEEMIMEIFLRLPVRSLCCMKRVCSSWRTLISTRDFTWNHLRRSSPHIIAYEDTRILSVESLLDNPSKPPRVSYLSGLRRYSICGSCHGFDTYKFLGIIRDQRPSRFENTISTRIYTFGPTSSWRRIDDDVPISCLTDVVDDRKGTYLGSSKGFIRISSRECGQNRTMDCVADEGIRRFSILDYIGNDSLPLVSPLSSISNRLKPLYISESDVLLAMSPSFRVVLFNLNNGRLDFSDEVQQNQSYFRHWFRSGGGKIYIYHESLVSPNGFQTNLRPKRLLHFL